MVRKILIPVQNNFYFVLTFIKPTNWFNKLIRFTLTLIYFDSKKIPPPCDDDDA